MEYELKVRKRERSGTSAARRMRREGWVPGVIYGRGREPLAVAVEDRELRSLLSHHSRGLVNLRVDDSEPLAVLVKSVAWHPITRTPLNVDFHAVSLTEKVHTRVPVVLVGEPEGVRAGGVLEHILREVEVSCLPTQIPDEVQVDVSALAVGHSLHVRDIVAPAGAEILTPQDEVVVVVAAPTMVAEVTPEEAAPAEAAAEAQAPAEGEKAAPAAGAQPSERDR